MNDLVSQSTDPNALSDDNYVLICCHLYSMPSHVRRSSIYRMKAIYLMFQKWFSVEHHDGDDIRGFSLDDLHQHEERGYPR